MGQIMGGESSELHRRSSAVNSARRDLLTGGITVAAILLFVGTGGNVVSGTIDAITGVLLALAARHGLPAPTHQAVYTLVKRLEG